jgi:hypothetical protein
VTSLVVGPRSLAALLVFVTVLVGCGARAAASFDPVGPCTTDGQRPGAYPALEGALPSTFEGAAPRSVDSGRNCSAANLGTLTRHGIKEVRFAGGLWETSGRSGVTMAVFSAPGLTVTQMGEFYESGAREARKTEAITTAPLELSGLTGRRLDTLNDESYQTIIVIEDREPDLVRAILVASDVREVGTREAHEAVVQAATEATVASIEAA